MILEGGVVYLGLRRDVGDAELRALVDAQSTAQLLDLLNPIEVAAGYAVLVPAGQLHAIGQGVLLLEVQEPEDLSILLEWDGFAIDRCRGRPPRGSASTSRCGRSRARRSTPAALEALISRATASGSVLVPAAEPFFSVERLPGRRHDRADRRIRGAPGRAGRRRAGRHRAPARIHRRRARRCGRRRGVRNGRPARRSAAEAVTGRRWTEARLSSVERTWAPRSVVVDDGMERGLRLVELRGLGGLEVDVRAGPIPRPRPRDLPG